MRILKIGTEEFPVAERVGMEGRSGLRLGRGENGWVTAGVQSQPSGFFFMNGILHAGTLFTQGAYWYRVETLYAELRFRSLVLSFGRKPLLWGESPLLPLIFSRNAQALDGIQAATLPVRLPWISGALGDVKTEFFLVRMDADRAVPNDYFTGWKFSLRPIRRLELGFSLAYQFGGKGAPEGTFLDTVAEIFGARGERGTAEHDSSDVTNRAGTFDLRLSFPEWRLPTTFYGEFHFEDCCGEIFKRMLEERLSYIFGAALKLNLLPKDTARVEYIKTTRHIYTHGTWPHAWSNRGQIMGHPLGPVAQRVNVEYSFSCPQIRTEFRSLVLFQERGRREWDNLPSVQEKQIGVKPEARFHLSPNFVVAARALLLYRLSTNQPTAKRVEGGGELSLTHRFW